MVEGESVMRMRDEGLVALLDIFDKGSVRDIMRFAGAVDLVSSCSRRGVIEVAGEPIAEKDYITKEMKKNKEQDEWKSRKTLETTKKAPDVERRKRKRLTQ